MRLHLLLSSNNTAKVPFNYQPVLTGTIHKWLGKNDVHDTISLYSFSWLMNGKARGSGLVFPNGAQWFFNAFDSNILKSIINGIQKDPAVAFGLHVSDIIIEEPPAFKDHEVTFVCASPVFIKRMVNSKAVHYTFDQKECDRLLTETLRNKLKKAGLSEEGVSVGFNRDYPGAKTKVIYYNRVGNRVNVCPVKIKGTPEQLAFAWDVGVGNSTGIGFGSLK